MAFNHSALNGFALTATGCYQMYTANPLDGKQR
jgi:hypothetical protein